jgi:hypothetical protein
MTLEFARSHRMIDLAPHIPISPAHALASQASRPAAVYQGLPSALVMVSGLLLVLVVLGFGAWLGWQRQDNGGSGGGGSPRPPAKEPTPPGGQQLTGDSAQPAVLSGDFAAWERQLRAADEEAPERRTDAPRI